MSGLAWVHRGDVIQVVNEIARSVEPMMVVSACPLTAKGYYCVNCGTHMVNIGNALMHAEAPGEHRLAAWCPTHRLYEQAEQSQIDAFAGVRS